MMKRIWSVFLVVLMVIGISYTAYSVNAAPEGVGEKSGIAGFGEIEGSKTAEKMDDDEYEITLSIPGTDTMALIRWRKWMAKPV